MTTRKKVLALAIPLAVVAATIVTQLDVQAGTDCKALDAGGRAAERILGIPTRAAVIWSAVALPMLLIGQRHLRIGVAIGVLCAAIVTAWLVVESRGAYSAEANPGTCPASVQLSVARDDEINDLPVVFDVTVSELRGDLAAFSQFGSGRSRHQARILRPPAPVHGKDTGP
jgi:hypothetical protein